MTNAPELRENLARVRARIDAAARRAGRDPEGVALVAVTKSVGADVVAELARIGVADVGENRPPDLAAKRAAVGGAAPLRWHMIGHFQRNKVRRALASVDVVHSVDSLALAEVLDAEVRRAGRGPLASYVQVNVSGESTKGGFAPADLEDALRRLSAMEGLSLEGLMTMAPWSDAPEASRPVFRALRELRDWALASGYLRRSGLSMGMSDDFETAVEEGATIVRVGRALVGDRP